jgi:hypothetical protein
LPDSLGFGTTTISSSLTPARPKGLERLRQTGSTLSDKVKAIVVIEVTEARPLISPAYDDGALTEAQVTRVQRARFRATPSAARVGER